MKRLAIIVVGLALLGLSVCALGSWAMPQVTGNSTPGPSEAATSKASANPMVRAQGVLVPARIEALSFGQPGTIHEWRVESGDRVSTGQVLARLGQREVLAANAAQARLEVLSAEQSLQELKDSADLARAQAQAGVAQAREELRKAQRRLQGLVYPDVQYYRERVEDAENVLITAQQNTELADIGALTASLQTTRDLLKRMEEKLGKIKAAIDGCPTCDPNRQVQVDRYPPQTLEDAQDDYNGALNRVRELELLLDQTDRQNGLTLRDAEKSYEESKADLAAAEKAAASSPDAIRLAQTEADVALAEAKLAQVERQLADMQSGPDPDQLALAEARLEAARAALTAAQTALTDAELRAPWPGQVIGLELNVGDFAAAGEPAAWLADPSAWQVETKDLDEWGVVHIATDQSVKLVLTAFDDKTLTGHIEQIDLSPTTLATGDTAYRVIIAVEGSDPALRWGMTVRVEFPTVDAR